MNTQRLISAFVRISSETQTIVETVHVGEIKARRNGSYLALFEDGAAWAVIFDDTLTTLARLE